MEWYVLYVLTGCELEVQRQLQGKGYTVKVLREAVLLRKGGVWREQTRVLLPGYVFVQIDYGSDVNYVMKAITGVIRLLPREAPQPLPPRDVAWLMSSEMLTFSKVGFSGENPSVVDGPLKNLERYITKFNRRRRRAQLRIPVLGESKDITLSILPV